ncbi:MAG: CPBP family intramembrane glutamic endopeptidase [Gammaproteobacteria bacterium]
MTRKQIGLFIGGLLSVSWIGQLLILKTFGGADATGAVPFLLVIMFLPGIFGLIFTVTSENVRISVPWRPAGLSPIIVAAIVPVLIAFTVLSIIILGGFGSSDYFQFGGEAVVISSGPWVLGVGTQALPKFAANILITTLIYSAMTGLATIGEEYGWRGVLQNAMIREFGFGKGVALLGFVWGIWHIPIILSGYNYPETPVIGAFLFMPVLLMASSFVIAWLTLWNRSFWPAVFMHGSINGVYDSMISRITLVREDAYFVKVIEIGVFVVLGLIAYFLARPIARTIGTGPARASG